jgi:Family of unknown function (DUF6134)
MLTLDRRALVAAVLSAAALPRFARAALPVNSSVHYNVLRNGKPFGNYQLTFVINGDTLTATTDVAMAAKIAGLTVFNYRHHCEEIWRGGRFMELHSNSLRDSDKDFCTAVRTTTNIAITNKDGPLLAPPSANPYTHWNPAVITGPMFNPETGAMLRLNAQPMGHEPFALANGSKVTANHWAMRGESEIDEWYEDSGAWAGLRAVFPDKSIVEYRRT